MSGNDLSKEYNEPEVSMIKEVENTIENLKSEARTMKRSSMWNRRGQIFFNAFIVILGVSTPALVTYQSLIGSPAFQFATIILTATIGAAATLQNLFRFNEHFILDANTSFELEKLASETRSKLLSLLVIREYTENWDQKIVELNDSALTMRGRIMTKHLRVLTENITVVTQADIDQLALAEGPTKHTQDKVS